MTFAFRGPASRKDTLLALLNAAVIASYTLIDGVGVRLAGSPAAYAMWLFLLNAIPLVAWALLAAAAPSSPTPGATGGSAFSAASATSAPTASRSGR